MAGSPSPVASISAQALIVRQSCAAGRPRDVACHERAMTEDDFGFATAFSHKDVRLFCEGEAEAMGVPMLAGNLVRQMLAVTKAASVPTRTSPRW
jgi:hypothetical protein